MVWDFCPTIWYKTKTNKKSLSNEILVESFILSIKHCQPFQKFWIFPKKASMVKSFFKYNYRLAASNFTKTRILKCIFSQTFSALFNFFFVKPLESLKHTYLTKHIQKGLLCYVLKTEVQNKKVLCHIPFRTAHFFFFDFLVSSVWL